MISRMIDLVMIRTFEHTIVERLAANSQVPVINGLTNDYHPCQLLADIYTYLEHRGWIPRKTVTWIGDSNNMCNSCMQAAQFFDFDVHVFTPQGYEPKPDLLAGADAVQFEHLYDPLEAGRGADLSPPTSGQLWAKRRRTGETP